MQYAQWASLSPKMSPVTSSTTAYHCIREKERERDSKTQNCSSQQSATQSLQSASESKDGKDMERTQCHGGLKISNGHMKTLCPKTSKDHEKSKTKCRPEAVACEMPTSLLTLVLLNSGSDIGLCQEHSHLASKKSEKQPLSGLKHGLLPSLAICEQEVKVIHFWVHLQIGQVT